jgi:eukaryotic-like serine/threonine-protein kinase
LLGVTISHYRVTEKLGSGGMGDVYAARDLLLGRTVAIKVLQSQPDGDGFRRQRFLQEARAASALNHPSIVTIYDVVQENDVDYIVMELVEGETLSQRIGHAELSLDDSLDLMQKICAGLALAHARGIVHRDLKPGNIMIPSTGGVKILDFGLAKFAGAMMSGEEAGPTAQRTRPGELLGTLEYMSPEQILGGAVDARSDIFSLGTILFEMVTGRRPFHSDSVAATLHDIAYRDPPDPKSLQDDVPEAISALITRMLAKRPEERFDDAGALGIALDEARQGRVAPPPFARIKRERFTWSKRTTALAIGIVATVILGVVIVTMKPFEDRPGGDQLPIVAASATEPLPITAQDHTARSNRLLDAYWRDGYIDQAIAGYQRAIALDANSAAAHAGLALAYWRKYRETEDAAWLDLALKNGQRSVEIEPQLAAAQTSLGLAEIEKGEMESATERFETTLKLDPENVAAIRGLGVIALKAGNSEEAERRYKQAIALQPADQHLYGDLGVLYYIGARYDEAANAFQRSIDLAPDNIAGYRNLGAVLHQKGDYAGAARILQRSLEIRQDSSVYSNLGTLYFFQGLYPQSVTAFEKAVASGANDFIVWSNLGDAYRWTPENQAKARDAFARSLQLLDEKLRAEPESAELLSRRALVLAKKGDRDPAMLGANALVKNGEGLDPQILYRLALTYELAGARERAIEQLDLAVTRGYSTEELRKDPELAKLRSDVRYHKMMIAHQ